MAVYTLRVRKDCRLDAFLRQEVPRLLPGAEASNSKLRRLVIAGCVAVDGRQCRIPSFALRAGSGVRIRLDETKFFFERQPEDSDFILTAADVLFEDEYLIIVNKPPFLPTEQTVVAGRRNLHQCVVDYLWKKNPSLRNPPYAGIMHRLDRETSGAVLFTKARSANAAVHGFFEGRAVRKTYRAVSKPPAAVGEVPAQFSVDSPIGRLSPRSAPCRMGGLPEDRGGLPAHTDVRLAGQRDGLFYFDCMPRTGRTHQIRVHLAQAGFPLAGDALYGGATGLPQLPRRIMLHAASLELPHPVSGQELLAEAPLPEGFAL